MRRILFLLPVVTILAGTLAMRPDGAEAATTERVNISSGGTQADLGGDFPAISVDGRFVAFNSYATNLVAGDTNNLSDVFGA